MDRSFVVIMLTTDERVFRPMYLDRLMSQKEARMFFSPVALETVMPLRLANWMNDGKYV